MSNFIIIFIIFITFHSHTQSLHIDGPTKCYHCYQHSSNFISQAKICPHTAWRTVNCPAGSSCFTKITQNSSTLTVHKSCVWNDLQLDRCLSETADDTILFCEICSNNFCNTGETTFDLETQRKVLLFSQVVIFVLTAMMLRDVFWTRHREDDPLIPFYNPSIS